MKLKKKQPDVSDSDKNLRNINTKVTSNKIRQVPTEAKLSEHIFPIRIRTNRWSDKRSWAIINNRTNKENKK